MQTSEHSKFDWYWVGFVAIAIPLIVLIDKLDFVARWLWHIEPYKDNIEHIIYACLLMISVLNIIKKFEVRKLAKGVKTFKANAGGFGFEVEFDNGDTDNIHCKEAVPKTENVAMKSSSRAQYVCREYVVARKIISVLNTELQLTFAMDTVLSRGGCRYRPDGFAVKNGRAYIVEVKVGDRPAVIERAIAQLKTFASMVQETKISHVTVILCVVTKYPTAYFMETIKKVDLGEETEFVFRTFSPGQLEGIEEVVS